MKRLSVLIVPLLLTAISCTKGGGSSPSQTPAQKPPAESGGGNVGVGTTTPDSVTPPGTNPTTEPFDEISENPNPEVCPWNLNSNKTVNAIRALGIRVKVDCAAFKTNDFKFNSAAIEARASKLDVAIEVLEKSDFKPALLVLAPRALHDSKLGLLQIGLNNINNFDIRRYVETSLKVLKFESEEFDGLVRFEHNFYDDTKDASGTPIGGQGSSLMWSPGDNDLDLSLRLLRRDKEQILSHAKMFPLVYLNSSCSVDEVNHTYTFAIHDSTAIDHCFGYLLRLKRITGLYSPTTIQVSVEGRSQHRNQGDMSWKEGLLTVAEGLRDLVEARPIQHIEILGWEDNHHWNAPIAISFDNQTLTITNVLRSNGGPKDPRSILACLEGQSFSAPFKMKCSGI